jgi:hypothetical protein
VRRAGGQGCCVRRRRLRAAGRPAPPRARGAVLPRAPAAPPAPYLQERERQHRGQLAPRQLGVVQHEAPRLRAQVRERAVARRRGPRRERRARRRCGRRAGRAGTAAVRGARGGGHHGLHRDYRSNGRGLRRGDATRVLAAWGAVWLAGRPCGAGDERGAKTSASQSRRLTRPAQQDTVIARPRVAGGESPQRAQRGAAWRGADCCAAAGCPGPQRGTAAAVCALSQGWIRGCLGPGVRAGVQPRAALIVAADNRERVTWGADRQGPRSAPAAVPASTCTAVHSCCEGRAGRIGARQPRSPRSPAPLEWCQRMDSWACALLRLACGMAAV